MRLEVAVNLAEARDHHLQHFFALVGREWLGPLRRIGVVLVSQQHDREQRAAVFIAELGEGMSLRKICRSPDMPSRQTVDRWADSNLEFAAKCARARVWQAEYMDDLIFDTAVACTPETAQADRVKISAFQWRASKLAPKVYGDKSEVAVTGPNNGPVRSETRLSLDPMEASRAYQRMMGEDK